MGFFNDLVNGSEKKYAKDPLANDINAAGKSGIAGLQAGANQLNSIYNQDPQALVDSQISMENKLARGAADDATRRTSSLLAQRGMGASSIGLGQEINQGRQLNNQLSMNNASGIARLRDMQIQNGQGLMNVGNSLYGVKTAQGPAQMQDQYARSGGYGQLIAAGIGAAGAAYGKPKAV